MPELPTGSAAAAPQALATLPPDPFARRTALAVGVASLALFLALAPFAPVQLGQLDAFIPVNQTALIVNDVITATLLFGQLRVARSRALLALACGYLFAAAMAVAHLLTFPGVFAPGGLLGAGPQSTAYLFIFWHTGFPLFVIAYALAKPTRAADASEARAATPSGRPLGVLPAVLAVGALAALLSTLATAGHDLLPPILRGTHYASAFNVVRFGQWGVTAAALAVLWWRRPHSLLDLWVMIAVLACFFEIGLVAIFNAGRYDVGFYAGRLYALLASTFVLIVLVTEQARLHQRLVEASETASTAAELRETREVLGLAMQGGHMGAWSRNLVDDTVWWSRELEEIFGLPPGGFTGTADDFRERVHPDDRPQLARAVQDAITGRRDYATEFRFRHATGEWRWMDGRGRATYAPDGRPLMLFGIGIDVTARKRSEQQAEAAEARFRTMVDGMPQLAWIAHPDGWVYWYNRRWYEYTGTTTHDVEGWGWQAVVGPEVLPDVMQRWQRSIATGEPFEMVLPLRDADGRFRPFLTRGSPLKDENGNVMHWFGTNTDITAQREAEEALRIADRRKDEFLATLGHELRNPLAPIRNAVEVMRRVSPIPPELAWARDVVDRQSRHLARLVDDLLDVARITQGKLQLRKACIALVDALQDAIAGVRPSAEAAGHEIALDLGNDPLYVHADPTRTVQVFSNLLNNAVKFTPAGGRIEVSAQRSGEEALVRIRDSGIGIDRHEMPKLFEMFSQVATPLERTESGLGIGLALVRGILELHGGTVTAHSAGRDRGSEFAVRLPLASTTGIEVHATPAQATPAPAQRRRILVADDNRDAASSLRMLLELAGHEVREVHDGRAAVEAATEFRPHLVLLDIGMPHMNGYDAAREIRRRSAVPDEPRIVAVTGWGQEHDRQQARAAGFDLHVTKPLDPGVLDSLLAPDATRQ